MPFSSLHTNSFICSLRGALAVALASLLVVALAPDATLAQTPSDDEAFIGTWVGTAEFGDAEVRVPFHIDRSEEGTLNAFTWAYFENHRIPVTRVVTRGDSLTLVVDRMGGQFAGELNADGSAIEGTLTQGPQAVPLTLRSAGDAVSIPSPRPQRPEADPADVKSIEAIVEASFEAISAPAGEEPDWDRFRSLFLPEARLIHTGRPGRHPLHDSGTVDEYIERMGKRQHGEGGFQEEAVHTVTERYGDIAHVFTTYEGRNPADTAEPTFRGVETIQLWHDGDRWWIASVMWHTGREDAPIPERYEGQQ